MWKFLLILALVPLIFYFSDSVRELFPSLSDWLPEASGPHETVVEGKEGEPAPQPAQNNIYSNQWILSDTEDGYVAWTASKDGAYRLAVGCYKDAPASVQVTRVDVRNQAQGQEIKKNLTLNYEYGNLPLEKGLYVGSDLVGSVAQFNNVYLQTSTGAVVAHFEVPSYISGTVAREVANTCAQ